MILDKLGGVVDVAWSLTSGEAGMRTQARGLAAAVARHVVEKQTPGRDDLLARLRVAAARPAMTGLAAPWPDLLVTCGRRTVPYALHVRRLSGGRTRLVHVQDPRANRDAFDLIVAMDHDRIPAGGNVIKVETALHDLTPELLADAGEAWRERFVRLGSRLAGVIVGGSLRGRAFTLGDGERLMAGLNRMREAQGLGLAITPSRRTPAPVMARLRDAFAGDAGVFLWDLRGDNPYRAILGLADRLVVTGDSVSMISEAISTCAPVDVMDLGFARHAGFLQRLVDQGRVRRFTGDPEAPASARPVNATATAAEAVRRRLSPASGTLADPEPATRR